MSRRLGRLGEERAGAFLLSKGYQILEKNFKSRRGEVDIVAESAGTLVFVEVKSWRQMPQSALEYAISPQKQRRIVSAAQLYLLCHPEKRGLHIRFDVVFVPAQGSDGINHFEGAFEPAGWHA